MFNQRQKLYLYPSAVRRLYEDPRHLHVNPLNLDTCSKCQIITYRGLNSVSVYPLLAKIETGVASFSFLKTKTKIGYPVKWFYNNWPVMVGTRLSEPGNRFFNSFVFWAYLRYLEPDSPIISFSQLVSQYFFYTRNHI